MDKYIIIGGNKFDHLYQHGDVVTKIGEYNFIFDGFQVVDARGVQGYVKKEHLKKESK